MTGDQRPKLATSPKETLYPLTKLTLIFITERQEGVERGGQQDDCRTGHKRNNRERTDSYSYKTARSNKRRNETSEGGSWKPEEEREHESKHEMC